MTNYCRYVCGIISVECPNLAQVNDTVQCACLQQLVVMNLKDSPGGPNRLLSILDSITITKVNNTSTKSHKYFIKVFLGPVRLHKITKSQNLEISEFLTDKTLGISLGRLLVSFD